MSDRRRDWSRWSCTPPRDPQDPGHTTCMLCGHAVLCDQPPPTLEVAALLCHPCFDAWYDRSDQTLMNALLAAREAQR